VRVVTHLATFRGESTFFTWVYRIAANHLLRFGKSRLEQQGFTFERFGKDLEEVSQTVPSLRMIPFVSGDPSGMHVGDASVPGSSAPPCLHSR